MRTKAIVKWDALKITKHILLLIPTENTKNQNALLKPLDKSQVCIFSERFSAFGNSACVLWQQTFKLYSWKVSKKLWIYFKKWLRNIFQIVLYHCKTMCMILNGFLSLFFRRERNFLVLIFRVSE